MQVADNLFVAIDYRLSLSSGEEIDRSQEGKPLGFVAGTGRILPGLEKALAGLSAGDRTEVKLDPEEGYGHVEKDLLKQVPRSQFPADAKIEPGLSYQVRGPRGPMNFTITAVEGDTVTIDLNHPLAGKALTFDVTVVEVREPRPEELPQAAQGCACGPGGDDECGPDCGCS